MPRDSRELLLAKRQQARQHSLRFWLLIILLLIFSASGAVVWLNQPVNLFSQVVVEVDSLPDAKIAESLVNDILAGRYWFGLKKSSRFFYPQQEIDQLLRQRLPKIAAAVFQPTAQELKISLTGRQARYLWCQSDGPDCQFLDETGTVFASAPHFLGQVYFEFAQAGQLFPLGTQVINGVEMAKWLTLKQSVDQLFLTSPWPNFTAYRLEFLPEGDFSLRLQRNSRTGPTIYGTLDNLNNFSSNLAAALASPELKTANPNSSTDLIYLDLRFGDKVFYK